MNENREKVLEYVARNPNCSMQEIAAAIGVSITTVSYHLDVLRCQGRVKKDPRRHRSVEAA